MFFLNPFLRLFFFVQFSDHLNSWAHPEFFWVNFWVRFEQNNAKGGHYLFQQIRGERPEFGVNTKFVLGLPRAKQIGVEGGSILSHPI